MLQRPSDVKKKKIKSFRLKVTEIDRNINYNLNNCDFYPPNSKEKPDNEKSVGVSQAVVPSKNNHLARYEVYFNLRPSWVIAILIA